jgi:hypothetical protein
LYLLSPSNRTEDAFVGYCEMETYGGGWLMCYTDDNSVDLSTEYAYDDALPYGTKGYRADCRNYPMDSVLYVDHTPPPLPEERFASVAAFVYNGKPFVASGGEKGREGGV